MEQFEQRHHDGAARDGRGGGEERVDLRDAEASVFHVG
jgi:hypothetical protein